MGTMRKYREKILAISLTFLLLVSAGCTSKSKKMVIDIPKLEHASITICFQGKEPNGMKEVLEEAEKRSIAELNVKLNFQFFYMDDDRYHDQMKSLISSGQNCDAFMVVNDSRSLLETFVEEGIAADITDLLSKYAPQISSQLDDRARNFAKVNNRLYAVPRLLPLPQRLGIAVRDDLLKKYKISAINNFDELEAFLEKVKQGESSLYPMSGYSSSIGIFAQTYGYVVLDYMAGLVYKWDDKNMTLSAWEQTPEYLEAEARLASWYRNGYIPFGQTTGSIESMYKTGKWAVILTNSGDSLYYNLRNLADTDAINYSYSEFTLYPESKASRVSPLFLSFVISNQSKNKERVLMFLDWIQAKVENYRLFRYGLEERDYTLVNESLTFPSTAKSPDDLFMNWYGGFAISNPKLEGPYWMGNGSYDFSKHWDEVCRNTEYVPHNGFVPDYTAEYSCYITRRSSINDTLTKMHQGQYQLKDSEDYIQKMKNAGTDKFVQAIQQQLDQWRKDNGQ
jgi:putative aldouronate transport system substrate-binding protein